MPHGYDSNTPLDVLIKDAEDSDNPQGDGFPDGARFSAREELINRGYSPEQIVDIRLGRWKPNYR